MSISSEADLSGMKRVSEAVAVTLKKMRAYASPGMSSRELDEFGRSILEEYGARSAPKLTYGFPGWTCISVNNEAAHGIPAEKKILQEGDLVNIDVSAELDGYWADNGGSFVLGKDINNHMALVNASRDILFRALKEAKHGVKIAAFGGFIENAAKKKGYRVIKNLLGHGVGRSLHEAPHEIPNFNDRFNKGVFQKNTVVAIETFISTHATMAHTLNDGWTLVAKGSFVAQHEHTIIITDDEPVILTAANDIWA